MVLITFSAGKKQHYVHQKLEVPLNKKNQEAILKNRFLIRNKYVTIKSLYMKRSVLTNADLSNYTGGKFLDFSFYLYFTRSQI